MTPDLDRLRIRRQEGEPTQPGPRRARIILVIAAGLLLLLGGLYLWGPLQPAQTVTAAVVSKLFPSQAFAQLNASGYVVAQRKAAVSSKSTGRLVFLGVEEGSRVKKGQVVASLENDDLVASRDQAAAQIKESQANLAQVQAELTEANLQYNRFKTLVAQDLVSRQDFDAAEARYRKAQAGIANAQARIRASQAGLANAQAAVEYSIIRSPFDGVVTTKFAEVGEVVAPFGSAANARAAVVTMADLNSLMVEADVAESNLDRVKVGQPCEISLDAIPDRRFPGEVHMIVPTADRAKATVLTKVKFLEFDERILPEMSAKVAFLSKPLGAGERQPRLALPKAALVTRNKTQGVFLIKANQAKWTEVATGEVMGDMVEIAGGLKEGDRVVVSPSPGLGDGSRIKLKES